jgi:signal transduction histidine kinase
VYTPLDFKFEKNGYSTKDYNLIDEENLLEINVEKDVVPVTQHPGIAGSDNRIPDIDENLIPTEIKKDLHFEKYKEEINQIVADLKEERRRLEESNKKIQNDIQNISDRLSKEKNLSPEQREELQAHALTLEKQMRENTMAFSRNQEKTAKLINTLREVILEKDALIKEAERKREIAEKKLNRNLIIFSIISFALLLLAIVFYTIAYKMRKQKNDLIISNSELIKARNELFEKMEEVNVQKDIIKAQFEKLDTFIYKVSHDLKGPLRGIEALVNLAFKEQANDRVTEILNHIGKTSVKLNKMVVDLLEISRSKSNNIQREHIDFNVILKDSIERFENLEEFKQIKINTTIDKGIEFESDGRILLSVFQNMLENAIKYQDFEKKNRYFNISIQKNGHESICLKFKDNGIGISEENCKKIFDMFYKIDPETSGSGLGLHITKINVEKLGGSIDVTSKEGDGTEFTILFPVNINVPVNN